MAQQLTLLDIAKLNGHDRVVGLIEENKTYAPELDRFPARTIRGTQYDIATRSTFPQGAFRNANEGVPLSKSTFGTRRVQTYIYSAAVRTDVAVALAYEDGPAALMQIEASGVMRDAMIKIGSQVYYGTSVDGKGFPGLQAIWEEFEGTDSSVGLSAGGDAVGAQSSVYGIRFGNQGVQFIFGQGVTFGLSDPYKQQVYGTNSDGDITAYEAWVASLTSWVGLQVADPLSVGRLYNVGATANDGVTDAKLAALLALYPVGYRPDVWLMNRTSAAQLQVARAATTITNFGVRNATGADIIGPTPTESNGIPIIMTDSIVNTEAVVG